MTDLDKKKGVAFDAARNCFHDPNANLSDGYVREHYTDSAATFGTVGRESYTTDWERRRDAANAQIIRDGMGSQGYPDMTVTKSFDVCRAVTSDQAEAIASIVKEPVTSGTKFPERDAPFLDRGPK